MNGFVVWKFLMFGEMLSIDNHNIDTFSSKLQKIWASSGRGGEEKSWYF